MSEVMGQENKFYDKFMPETYFVPGTPSSADPMGERSYLGVKIGVIVELTSDIDPDKAIRDAVVGLEERAVQVLVERMTKEKLP